MRVTSSEKDRYGIVDSIQLLKGLKDKEETSGMYIEGFGNILTRAIVVISSGENIYNNTQDNSAEEVKVGIQGLILALNKLNFLS
ncbi:MAG: hypothetical protein RCG15_03905 [Candidatus Rickettsia vulgarisii]